MHLFVSSIPLTTTTTLQTTTEHPTPISNPSARIIFSHDTNPFDPSSSSFISDLNPNTTAPVFDAKKPFNGSPMARYTSVLPLARALKPQDQRKDRMLVFRPLFVYRQQEAKKQQMQMQMQMQLHMRPPPYPYLPYGPPPPSHHSHFNYPPGHFDLYDESPIQDIGHNHLPHAPSYDWQRLPESHFWEK